MAFRNNNPCCERLIGRSKDDLLKKLLRDDQDVDQKMQSYINHAYYDNN